MARMTKARRRATLQETANLYQLRYGTTASTPSLVLRGQWLEAAGFGAGNIVTITVDYRRLTIEVEQGSAGCAESEVQP